ncbi:single-stranded DNA-binding protein, partial [Streptomyces sp. NPDC020884]
GVKRTVYELDVEEVGPSLKNATAKVTKTTGRGGQGGYGGGQTANATEGTPADDPWASNAAPPSDEPPF